MSACVRAAGAERKLNDEIRTICRQYSGCQQANRGDRLRYQTTTVLRQRRRFEWRRRR